MEYTVTEIHLPSATGCNHVHIHVTDQDGNNEVCIYHLSDFMKEKTITDDPIYDFLYSEVQRLRLRRKQDIKKELHGIKIYT